MPTGSEWVSQARSARARGDREEARSCYAQAAAKYRQQGDALACAHAVRHIADVWMEETQLARAQPLYEEALNAYRGSYETRILDLANTVRPFALLQEAAGNREQARALWEEARVLYGSLRVEEGVAECEAHLSSLGKLG